MSPNQLKSKTKQETLPLLAPKNTPTSSSSSSSVDDYCILSGLTLNIINAYAHNDGTVLGFVLVVNIGYFVISYCSTLLHQLPPNEKSFKKLFLKYMICGLAATILFGLAYQMSTFMSPTITLLSYAIAGTSTWSLVYVYFMHDHKVCENVMPPSLGADNV